MKLILLSDKICNFREILENGKNLHYNLVAMRWLDKYIKLHDYIDIILGEIYDKARRS
jgi:hypothetical protein